MSRKQTTRGGRSGAPRTSRGKLTTPTGARKPRRARGGWRMKPHHRQRFGALLLVLLSLVLAASLTVLRTAPGLAQLADGTSAAFGLSAYLLSAGLIAFAIAHLVESFRRRRTVSWKLVIGLLLLWGSFLMELQLLLGGPGGANVLAPLGAFPAAVAQTLLSALPAIWWELIFLLLFAGDLVVVFGLRPTHVAIAVYACCRGVAALWRVGRSGKGEAGAYPAPSPFLGQRPRFSRYSTAAWAAEGSGGEAGVVGEEPLDLPPASDERQAGGWSSTGARGAPGEADLEAAMDEVETQHLRRPQEVEEPEYQVAHAAGRPPAPGGQGDDPAWVLADLSLLNTPEEARVQLPGDDPADLAHLIQETLRSFRVEAEVLPQDISVGPTVIRFGIRPTGKPAMKEDETGRPVPLRDGAGNITYESRTRVSRIMALQNDLALVLEAKSIRMSAPVPGEPFVGVEIPNKQSRLVTLREVLESKEYRAARVKSRLCFALGRDVAGAVRVGDLAKMPHLLIAGATGSGKSVCLNAIIGSLLTQATPDDVRLLMIDPKMVELNMYNGIPHLLSPVVTEIEHVVGLLKIAVAEMERRYRTFSQLSVRNLDAYRKLRAERMTRGDTSLANLPAIVIIIDELADLMMAAPDEVEGLICRLAQLARATGIHLVVATQRPSVDVITGLIKANIPTRISFMVSSQVDSRTIIDAAGAERLLGRGDMLYLPAEAGRPERIQGAFEADDEVERIVAHWRRQAEEHAGAAAAPTATPDWQPAAQPSAPDGQEDDLLEQAEQVVRESGRASISLLQRRLRIGYSRAGRLIDQLEERGVIGPAGGGTTAREVRGGPDSGQEAGPGAGATIVLETQGRRSA
jgi:hypothetical protein